MQFSFAQIEHTLACAQNIREDRRSAFANRLKNYQKAGFPEGINTGRGRAATYGLGHLLQMGLALELNQLGLNPERTAAVIKSDKRAVAKAYYAAAGEAPHHSGTFVLPSFLFFDPASLSDLMIERAEDRAVGSFQHANLGKLKQDVEIWGKRGVSRVSLVNVSAVLWDLASYAPQQPEGVKHPDHYNFYQAVKAWASPIIHDEKRDARNPKA